MRCRVNPTPTSARLCFGLALAWALGGAGPARAQQLEPRAYAPVPVGAKTAGLIYVHSSGDVTLDPSVPIENLQAQVQIVAPYFARFFGLFDRLASVSIVAPAARVDANGEVQGNPHRISRSGMGDPSVRFAINLLGSPALGLQAFQRRSRDTILGASLTVSPPLGQYDPTRLINLGTNRWSFKPELGFSQPLGAWDLELYAGVWLFTANPNFFGGHLRQQDPLVSTQAHAVYTFRPNLWVSLDYTYYAGGTTTIDGQAKSDRQDNSRTGLTLTLPVARQQGLKLIWSRGVSTRVGQDFDSFGVGWNVVWF